jgi:tetratricopeptide (TPR) repeat protein
MSPDLLDRRRVSRLCLLALAAGCSSAALAQAPTPAADHSQEAVIVEQARTLYRFEKDGTGRRELYMRLKAQSEAGVQQWGQLVFGYNAANERSDVAFVRVRKPDGTTVTTPEGAVQDLSAPVQRIAPIYTDFRQKHVTVQGLRPGDTLEFSVVTSVHTALASGQFWTEYAFNEDAIVRDEQLDIDVPADHPITLKTRTGFEPVVRGTEGRTVYHWSRSNLTREDDEAGASTSARDRDEDAIAPIRLTTFHTWEQVGRWYAALESPQRTPTAEIRKKAAELTAGRSTELDKIEALYSFVATNFRYVSLSLGLGRYQPRRAADVLREQYGDCKDKHTLLSSLIEAAGMRASAVLIHSSTKLDPSFPSPSQFDHVITRAIASGQEVWVDTTSEVAPFQLLSAPLRNKQALVVDAAGAPRLQDTPANPPMKSFMAREIDAKLGESGQLDAHARLTFRGDAELVMRTVFRSTPAGQWKKVLEGLSKLVGADGEVSNWKVSDPAALKDPFTMEFDLSVSRYGDWSSNKVSLRLPLAASDMPSPGEEDEEDPLELGAAPTEISYKLRLQLPPNVTARAPLPVSVARDYAEYRASYTVSGSTFSAERFTVVRQSELPSDRRPDYAAFARVVSSDARQSLALVNAAAAAANAPGDLKTAELNRRGYAALQAGNYAEAVALLERAVELEPKDKNAWNNLGWAQMQLRQFAAAIDAYRKQIEVNPYHANVHTNLGRAYLAMQRYSEAEAALQKQFELNPLDRYAPAHLAQLYLEQRQYASAIPQLDRAIALTPDDAWLQLQLGKAHLHLKQEAEAIAAYDRAVELSPTPTTWNDIAYELALRGVHLDRAQQYAESAVSSSTAASRTLDIARADNKAMAVVQSLAPYWDTLGWVYFVRGDAARAVPLVEAAWRLGQHGEVGDHLAQIYEKLGRRQDAIRTYALALAAERPPPDTRDRLARLIGDKAKIDDVVNAHRAELTDARTVPIGTTATAAKTARTADFLVLFSSPSLVENVKFVSGDAALQPLDEAIRKASYGPMFPDGVPARILRRGIVACAPPDGRCSLTFVRPDDLAPIK